MNKRHILFLLFLVILNNIRFNTFSCDDIASKIISVASPSDLERTIINNTDQTTLIVFDIDDTLILSNKPILRANALNKLINNLRTKLNCDIQEAISLIEWKLLITKEHLGYGLPVSMSLVKTLQNLINQGVHIIALTKVESGNVTINIPTLKINSILADTYEDRRYQDLKNIGLDFSKSFQSNLSENQTIKLQDVSNPLSRAIYKNGIILSSKSSKGNALLVFLNKILWRPKKIIFIDNYLYNIDSVKNVLKKINIPFIGIHFTFVNNKSDRYPDDVIKSKASCLINNAYNSENCLLDNESSESKYEIKI